MCPEVGLRAADARLTSGVDIFEWICITKSSLIKGQSGGNIERSVPFVLWATAETAQIKVVLQTPEVPRH